MVLKSYRRTRFLKILGFGVLSTPLLGLRSLGFGEDDQVNKCGFTDSATEGPFFVKNSPGVLDLNYSDLPGKPMEIQGVVYGDEKGEGIVSNAKIEIWHCDNAGAYHPSGSGDISRYRDAQIKLRGFVVSSEKGQFSFRSIVPGLYGSRRRHVHYKVTADGYQTLTTQSYWVSEKADRRSRADQTDRNTEDCRYVNFQKNQKGTTAGVFNIFLRRA